MKIGLAGERSDAGAMFVFVVVVVFIVTVVSGTFSIPVLLYDDADDDLEYNNCNISLV